MEDAYYKQLDVIIALEGRRKPVTLMIRPRDRHEDKDISGIYVMYSKDNGG